jgi:flagellar biosynthetic protein FliP
MHPTLNASSIAMDKVQKATGAGPEAQAKVVEAGLREWKKFLVAHAHPEQLQVFASSAMRIENSQTKVEETNLESNLYQWRSLVPAFVVSELKEAFATGLSLLLPFLVLDLFIATLLLAVGYEDLNPLVIAFPFKLLLFVLVDGWSLITSNLVETYISR